MVNSALVLNQLYWKKRQLNCMYRWRWSQSVIEGAWSDPPAQPPLVPLSSSPPPLPSFYPLQEMEQKLQSAEKHSGQRSQPQNHFFIAQNTGKSTAWLFNDFLFLLTAHSGNLKLFWQCGAFCVYCSATCVCVVGQVPLPLIFLHGLCGMMCILIKASGLTK